ncbi:MAG TPA: sodium/glutamate symporter [Vicinamibacterales bacterium]|nr:sodium/glutamate symporter [Vicinamibacterales bacterium]
MLRLDLIQTVACAGLILFAGYGLKKLIPALARYNIPAPVAGGLPVAALFATFYAFDWRPVAFDITLQLPLQNTFFASVGYGASVLLLKRGGPLVLVMMIVASVAAALQNVLGAGVAMLLGEHPLMGVLAGSVTLTGGPATGLAFAPLFEQAGVPGASTLAVSAAMVGIIAGGLLGGPIGTYLLDRHPKYMPAHSAEGTLANLAEPQFAEPASTAPAGEDVEAYGLLKHLVLMITAVGVGMWVSAGIASLGITMPATIGAMIVAALIRNFDDLTGLIGMSQRTLDDLGSVALALFLVMALMSLRLWELAGVVVPLLVILVCQVLFVAALCLLVVPRLLGKDYDSIVMSSGFCGFMLGTTANAVANMGALVERYGPAPKAYLVVPLVGAFGIDFVNLLLITVALNIWA